MYKIMIAEDEKIEREHLVRVIDALELPFERILVASNGQEGMELFAKWKPEIVIVDINMPVMDGLAMIEQIRTSEPDTLCYILSSYNYFNYAQRALRLGVIDFILKPADRHVIHDCLMNAMEHLKARKHQQIQKELLLAKVNVLNQEIMKDCFYAIMTYKDEMKIRENLKLLGIKAVGGICFYLRNGDMARMEELRERMDEYGYDVIYHKMDHHIVLFALANHMLEEKDVTSLRNMVMEIFAECTYYCGKCADDIGELIVSYEDAKRKAQADLRNVSRQCSDEDIRKLAIRFLDLIEMDDKQAIREDLDPLFEMIGDAKFYECFHSLLEYCAQEIAARYDILMENHFLSNEEYQNIRDAHQLEMTIMEIYVMIQKVLRTVHYTKNQYNYKRACDYIEKHYLKPITSGTVADALHISPSYLSRLISKNGNESFTDMVNALRIKEAKKQIRQGIPFKEVAHNVGFSSQSYFTKIFKKLAGMSPSDYKNMF